MSAQSGLTFEVHALRRELQAFELVAHAETSDAVVTLVRAARRLSRLAQEVASDPSVAEAARDEVSLARVTNACLADEGGSVDPADLQAAIALIATRVGSSPAGTAGALGPVQGTLAAITNPPGATGK